MKFMNAIILLKTYDAFFWNGQLQIKKCIFFEEYSIASLAARFGVHDVDFSLSLLSHSCPAKARASERHRKRARTVRDRRRDDVLSRSVFQTPATPSFASAPVAQANSDGRYWSHLSIMHIDIYFIVMYRYMKYITQKVSILVILIIFFT